MTPSFNLPNDCHSLRSLSTATRSLASARIEGGSLTSSDSYAFSMKEMTPSRTSSGEIDLEMADESMQFQQDFRKINEASLEDLEQVSALEGTISVSA